MKKYITLIAMLVLLLLINNLFAENIYITVWNATGYEMNECYLMLDCSYVVENATWNRGYNNYVFPVDNPSSASVWGFGNADCYGWGFYANGMNGQNYYNPNTGHWETTVEISGVYNPSEINFVIEINNEIEEASNCSLVRNPNTNPETLFSNQTISTGITTYTQYEICVDDDLMIEGDVDGFYSGQVYDVSDLEVVDYDYNSSTNVLDIFADLDLEYDDTPPDYDYNVTNLSASGWNWVSFPVLDPSYDDPIDYVLEPILDDLDIVLHQDNWIYEPSPENWQNNIGDFRSVDGYKIDMDQNANLTVAGYLESPSTVMYLDEDVSKGLSNPILGVGNWIGYFVPGSCSWTIAFSQIMDKITFVKADDWCYIRGYCDPSVYPTVDYGKSYIVGVSEDCSFSWTSFGKGTDPYVKPETIIFTYEEQADYMPIFVDETDALDGVDEIGVFLGEECIGASVIEEFPVFVPAYVKDETIKDDAELTFRTASYDDKSITKNISVFVYDEKEKDFFEESVVLDNMNSALIKLGIGEEIEIPTEFIVHQNYPNPVNGTTTISFTLPENNQEAQVTIYNVKGQLIKELAVKADSQGFNAVWDCTDVHSKPVSNGIYFYKVTSGDYSELKKMLLAQ